MSLLDGIVIGAGPYGLSIAAHLRARNARFALIGKPMEMWRSHMPKGMMLKSEPFASSLSDPDGAHTLQAFFRERGRAYAPIGVPTPLEDFLDYAEWFRQKADLAVQDRKLVRLRKAHGRFELVFEDGEHISARRVVLATGLRSFRWTPPLLQTLPGGLLSHASDLNDPAAFIAKDVIVVGAGQSAVETAALLHEAGAHVRLLVRRDNLVWNGLPRLNPSLIQRLRSPESGLSAGWRAYFCAEKPHLFSRLSADTRRRIVANGWGPSGSWWLKDRIVGKVPVLAGHKIERAREQDGRVRLYVRGPAGESVLTADHVISATGYRIDIDQLPFFEWPLRNELRIRHGAPVLTRSFESTAPGLYFVGPMSALTFGPVMRFIFGAKHTARALALELGGQPAPGRSGARGPVAIAQIPTAQVPLARVPAE